MPRYIIADRRDLLGGRLLTALNGMRLARILGAKFLMTWYTDHGDFQKMVTGINELFSGEFIEPFDEKTGRGTIIDVSDDRLLKSASDFEILKVPEEADTGIGDLLAVPRFSESDFRVYRNFSSYTTDKKLPLSNIYKELSTIFYEIPKTSKINSAIAEIDDRLAGKIASAVHVRRIHLMSETGLQLNRFQSFVGTEYCSKLIDNLLTHESDFVLVGSDNLRVVDELRRRNPKRVIALDSVIDVTALTPFQCALIDMYFLSKGKRIYGPRSAYGLLASIIGGGKFINILIEIAKKGITGEDKTGSIAYWQQTLRKPGQWRPANVEAKVGQSAFVAKLALPPDGTPEPADVSMDCALTGLAMRLCQYRHQSFFGDWQEFVTIAKNVTRVLREAAHLQVLERLEHVLKGRQGYAELILEADGLPDRRSTQLLRLATLAAGMDCAADAGDQVAAIKYFHSAEEVAKQVHVNPRGLRMRVAGAFQSLSRPKEAISVLRQAVEADPAYADSHYLLGMVLESYGEHEESEAEFRRAVQLQPDSGPYWHHLGKCLLRGVSTEEAEHCFRQATLCEPQNETFAQDLHNILSKPTD